MHCRIVLQLQISNCVDFTMVNILPLNDCESSLFWRYSIIVIL